MWEDIIKKDVSVSRKLLRDVERELRVAIGISKRGISYGDTTLLEDLAEQLKSAIDESYRM